MMNLKCVLIAAMAGVFSTAALGQVDPRVPANFVQLVPVETGNPLVGKVSQSRPSSGPNKPALNSQVTYKFTVENKTTNDLNRVFFEATFQNIGGSDLVILDTTIPAESASLTKPYCTKYNNLGDGTTRLRCELGSLAPSPASSSANVYVIANVPTNGQQIRVDWRGGGYEGNGNGDGCCQPSNTYFTQMVDRLVDQSYTFNLQTFVKKEGTELFTGDAFTPLKSVDLTTTYVKVPKIADDYVGDVDEYSGQLVETPITPSATGNQDERDCQNFRHFTTCFNNEVTIPKANFALANPSLTNFPEDKLLDVIVRVDSSVVRPNVSIGDVTLYYVDESTVTISNPLGIRTPIYECIYNVDNTLPKGNLPCWTKRFEWAPNMPGYTTNLKKDLQWNLKHYKNGGWKIM